MPTARDNYRAYYTEKLWEWLPAIYREQDALEGPGLPNHALHAFITALAGQAAMLKRDQDRLWDDAYVELADDWAVPYLAELLGTRLVSAQNPRARRIDVAKTVYYRRRKGTVPVLEQLIGDMAAWDGKVVEQFRRLARAPHGLDGPAPRGRLTGTPAGGLADLRSVRGARLADDPFGEFHYTPDMRRPDGAHGGRLGQRGIAKLNIHVYRMRAVEFSGVHARRMVDNGGADGYTVDPSGRDTPLFCAHLPKQDWSAQQWSAWQSAEEWQLPRALSCRLLGEAIFEINAAAIAVVPDAAAAADLRKLAGMRFAGTLAGSAALRRLIDGMPGAAQLQLAWLAILDAALVQDCAAVQLYPASIELAYQDGTAVPRAATRAAQLAGFSPPPGVVPGAVTALIDPRRGRLLWDSAPHDGASTRTRHRVGMLGAFGAGGLEREISANPGALQWHDGDSTAGLPASGVVDIADSASYPQPPDGIGIRDAALAARQGQRPYLRLDADWHFKADGEDRTLVFDGLWIGAASGLATPPRLVLDGNFEKVTLRYCTLDPGGKDALGATLPAVGLVIQGYVEELVIERCIASSVRTEGAGIVVRIALSDSVLQAPDAATPALDLPRAALWMRRTTLIGAAAALLLAVQRLDASDSLVAGRAEVADAQNGCFRFGARAPGSQLPHPYASVLLDAAADNWSRVFASLRFGDPAYASLSAVAPPALLRGAEQGLEMGAFNDRALQIKQDSLRVKIDEYLPFGRLPNVMTEN